MPRIAVFAWLTSLALAAPIAHVAEPASSDSREQMLAVPMTDGFGQKTALKTRLCRPAGASLARLVIINHGSPADPSERPTLTVAGCDREAVQWFLTRGYAVALPIRRGYGATGGPWAEAYGPCVYADYYRAGLETARDIDAAVNFLTAQPGIRPDGVVVVGQSAGGWGSVAYDSVAHPKVVALIAMAGGRGGHENGQPGQNCAPERLADAAGKYGASATTPMLWVYTHNDTFFPPRVAEPLYQAFAAAGGKAEFMQPEAYGSDGHGLFFGRDGSKIWGPLMERYLAERDAR